MWHPLWSFCQPTVTSCNGQDQGILHGTSKATMARPPAEAETEARVPATSARAEIIE